eukprot:GGOE01001132.1.p1 GENE.GGOE01001132.1~~GGOE01001132.1.p1  ORF type:complete len:933 (+),score=316.89 GGOE01001132.1:86-2884(+)
MNFLKNINNIIEQAAEKVQTAIDGNEEEEDDAGLASLPPRELLEVAIGQQRRIHDLREQLESGRKSMDELRELREAFKLQNIQMKELQVADNEKADLIHLLEQQLHLGQTIAEPDDEELSKQVAELQAVVNQNSETLKRAEEELATSREQLQRKEMIFRGLRAEMDQQKTTSDRAAAEAEQELEHLRAELQKAESTMAKDLDAASTNGLPAMDVDAWQAEKDELKVELQQTVQLVVTEQAKVAALTSETAAAATSIEHLTKELNSRNADCHRAEQQATQMAEEMAQQAQELSDLKTQIQTLQTQLEQAHVNTEAAYHREVETLSQQLRGLSTELHDRDKELSQARESAAQAMEEHKRLLQCLEESEQHLTQQVEEQAACAQCREEVAVLHQQLATMAEELHLKDAQLDQAAQHEHQQQAELQGLTESMRHLSQEVELLTLERERSPPDAMLEEVNQLRQLKDRGEEKLIRIQSQLHAVLQESEALQVQLQEKAAQLEATEQRLAGIDAVHQQEVLRVLKENKDLTFRLNAVEQKLDLAMQELSEAAAKMSGLGSSRDKALQQLQQCEAGAQVQLQALERELKEEHQMALETAEAERQRQVQELEGRLYHAEEQRKAAVLEMKALARVVEEQQKQVQTLQEEKAARVIDGALQSGPGRDCLTQEVGQLQQTVEELQAALEGRAQEQETMATQLHQLSGCLAEREGHMAELQAQLEELEREVEQKEGYAAELLAVKGALEQQLSLRSTELRQLQQMATQATLNPVMDEAAIRAEEEAKRRALQESLSKELADRETHLANAQAVARQKAKEAAQAQALLLELEAKVAELEKSSGVGDKGTIGRQCDNELTASLQEELRVARSKLSDMEARLVVAIQRQSLQDVDLWPAIVIAAAAFVRAVVYAWGVCKRHAVLAYGLARQRYEELRREAPPARPI